MFADVVMLNFTLQETQMMHVWVTASIKPSTTGVFLMMYFNVNYE